MEIMWNKKYQEDVKVYYFKEENNHTYAFCFIPAIANKQEGNGWAWIRIKELIAYPQAEKYRPNSRSKTQKNKIKDQLTLVDATWACTDGFTYSHADLEQAITHQEQINKGM